MTELTAAQMDYLSSQLLGRIATTGADGKPHVVPTSFRYNAISAPSTSGGTTSRRRRSTETSKLNPWAAIVVDDLVSTDPSTRAC